ncbi:MAG: SLBB domain-containing protein, partial [Luminiphilus sp.]|nr:SLBB domain-containing protein [Luminiphilus sp.]
MKLSATARIVVFGVFASVVSVSALGQGLPPGVTPGMVDQLKSLSPAQQQALARQYGITLPAGTAADDVPVLAAPGAMLPTPMGMTQDDIEAATPDKTEEVETRARTRYGRALFSRDVSTFAPTDDAPVPESYRLGVGDQLIVQLFGKENEQLNLQIGRSGDVSFPKLGSITLSGLTFEDARDLINTRVEQQLIGVNAIVSMGRLRAINVFMAGEVSVPGAYSVSAMTTVTQALFQAGGVTDIGSLRSIQVRRAGSVVATFDTYALLMKGDVSDDIRLQSGDVVFVPPYTSVIDVEGELKRPMVYELAGGETMGDVLAMAGSFTRDAYPALSILTRQSDSLGLPQATTIDLSDASQLSLAAQDGDTLKVPKVGNLVTNSVSLKGAVTRPGSYGWVPGMRVSDLMGNARRDLSPDADLGLGMIVRQKNALLDIDVVAFDLASVIASPDTNT